MPTDLAASRRPATLLAVDGHAYAYRAFHAIRKLNAPSGAPTNAIYGFIKMLGRLQALLGPTHLVVVWDGGLACERLADLPEYKQHRPPMPPDLESQIVGIGQWLNAAGLASRCRDAVEADDWIAAIARGAESAGFKVVIASSDKDFMQLVSPGVALFNPNDKTEKVWTEEEVRARTGVAPAQIVDWLSLIGDSVDNIPGVPGVGAKTAAELLQRFDSIDQLYLRLGEVPSEKLRAALEASAPAVQRNRRLIRLNTELPVEAVEQYSPRAQDVERLRALYSAWGFKGLLAALESTAPVQVTLL